MVQVLPTVATFTNGEGRQPSATFYVHGSIDGGHDTYSVGGAAAVWDGADGGIGIDSPDTAVGFAGHENDDAGTGGPYSTRLGCLLLRPQIAASEDYEVEIAFQFQGSTNGERVAVFSRVVPDTFTAWETRGINGLRKPHFFEKAIQGVGLEVDDSGAAILFSYTTSGVRTSIATGTVTVGTSTHTLTLLISSRTITPTMDGSAVFSSATYSIPASASANSRGHAAFGLTRTQATGYPLVTSFQVRDFLAPLSPVIVLRDEWTRTPELEGTIVPTGAVPNTIDFCPHRLFEWGGNRIAAIGADPVGPWLQKDKRRYGPKTTAAGITNTTVVEWLDIYTAGAATATQVANIAWDFSMLSGTIGGNVAIGVAARATKSAIDPGTSPTLANATAYVFRFVFAAPFPYFEILRLAAGVETRLEQTRPMNLFTLQPGDTHTLSLQVEDSGGDPVLDASWTDHLGVVHQIYNAITDSDAAKITAAGSLGIYAKVSGLNGGNPGFNVSSLSITGTSIPPPTTVTEATVFGPVPFVPEFAERAQEVYRTLQRGTDRMYVYSHREFIEPRVFFTASWLLPDDDAQTMQDFLLARNQDRQAMTIIIDGVSRNLVSVDSEFDTSHDAGGFRRIGPVAMMEIL